MDVYTPRHGKNPCTFMIFMPFIATCYLALRRRFCH